MEYGHRFKDFSGQRFGRLTVIKRVSPKGEPVKWLCKCECGNEITTSQINLASGDTQSCGCLKQETDPINLREKYDEKRVDGVVMPLFKDKKPRKDSSTGYRGVSRYYTRVSKKERYRAWITVKGKRYYKSGFETAEEAYYEGRLPLEKEYLPEEKEDENS